MIQLKRRRHVKSQDRPGTSLVVQWLRLRASTAGGAGSIPGRGIKMLRAAKKKTQKLGLLRQLARLCMQRKSS